MRPRRADPFVSNCAGWVRFGSRAQAFVFPIFFHRQLVAVAENPRIRPFLLGVAAGVPGLIAAVTIDILEQAVVDVPTAILAAVRSPRFTAGRPS